MKVDGVETWNEHIEFYYLVDVESGIIFVLRAMSHEKIL